MSQSATKVPIKVAIMGSTGTGKSAFVHHLTNDTEVRIGHNIDSETSEIQISHYTDVEAGRSIMLVDTPGFDDSRVGITDIDILQKIIDFLQPEEGEERQLNGIIYMHRISDPRLGGLARKNLRMLEAMCGKKCLPHVRIITTYWDRDDGKGLMREDELKQGPFKPLLTSGAKMCRYLNTIESAQSIMAELIPLPEVRTRIQEEVTEDIPLGETSAGRIISNGIEELRKKHEKMFAGLRKGVEKAVRVRDEELRAELEAERKDIEEKNMRAEEDRQRLMMTVQELRDQQKKTEKILEGLQAALTAKTMELEEAWNATNRVMEVSLKELEKQVADLRIQNDGARNYARRGLLSQLLLQVLPLLDFILSFCAT